jgi:cardiolipin synthase A/B
MPTPDLLEHAFTRTAGAPLIEGNAVRVLKDAAENYPAWLEAIHGARSTVFFENYLFNEDEVGLEFQRALIARAREGVRVRVIYDWLGSLFRASAGYWRALQAGGVEVRCFNPPRFVAPFGALHRDHRKMLAVDGRVGFITGLCVGRQWLGDPSRGVAPWRDTGIEVRGPAMHDIEQAFAQAWGATGAVLSHEEQVDRQSIPPAGAVALRIVASAPGLAAVLRLDQLVAAAARRTLWLTDAYFAGIPWYVQALQSAARDGVDVRLLVPGATDITVLRPLSAAGYRPLLEAGVRVFEWKGSMLHAKTAVADGRWARVGSSNLNIASWMGNFELDAVIEDASLAVAMQEMYLADLERSTEIVLERRRRFPSMPHRRRQRVRPGPPSTGEQRGSASRAAAGALRIGRTVSAALSEQRVLAPTEARLVAGVALVLVLIAAAVVVWPRIAAVPAAALLVWAAVALCAKALALRRERRMRGLPRTKLVRTESMPVDTGAVPEPAAEGLPDRPPSAGGDRLT